MERFTGTLNRQEMIRTHAEAYAIDCRCREYCPCESRGIADAKHRWPDICHMEVEYWKQCFMFELIKS